MNPIVPPSSGDDLRRHYQSKSISAVRWLPSPSTMHRLFISAVESPSPCLDIHALSPTSSPELLSSFVLPSPVSSLRVSHSAAFSAAATLAGSLHLVHVSTVDGSVDLSDLSVGPVPSFHRGGISSVDLDGRNCATVGEDGRINLVILGEGRLETSPVHDSRGLVGYTAVRWASPAEFATGGLGFGLQWWDHRRPGGPVAQFKANWPRGNVTGMVHSLDIHPSRKHTCVAGGSSGTVFAWDLRRQEQPILLSGVGLMNKIQPASESEVWEVQYDIYTHSSRIGLASSTKILPIMISSEDGILSVLQEGEQPLELLAEPCAINAFDIDPQNPSDVICALEWESVGILTRQKEAKAVN